MFELPKDIEQSLKRRYPSLNIQKLFNDIMDEILNKTFTDGTCPIKRFGKFSAFNKYSTKKGRNLVKFKFATVKSFTDKIKEDEYLLNQLPVKAKNEFNENHKAKCEGKEDEKQSTRDALREANQYERKVKDKRLARNEILNALMKDNDEDE